MKYVQDRMPHSVRIQARVCARRLIQVSKLMRVGTYRCFDIK